MLSKRLAHPDIEVRMSFSFLPKTKGMRRLPNRYRQNRHMEFMDVGLPFRKHGYRDFVLRFGGKQSSTRRWFRVNWSWLNKLLVKFYV